MSVVLLALAFVLAVIAAAFALVLYAPTSRPAQRIVQWRDRALRRAPPQTVTVINNAGEEIDVPVPNTGDTVRVPYVRRSSRDTRLRPQTVVVVVALLIALISFSQLPRLLRAQPDSFIVLVAPFRAANGDTANGNAVAQQLAAALPSDAAPQLVVQTLDAPPETVAAALTLMEREGADVLIGGELAQSESPDQLVLPVLLYRPTGTFAPAGLDGYAARFALPLAYPLANTPIDGQAVLPPLLAALYDYSAGNFTTSFERLELLLRTNEALRPELARSLRGNMLWASGQFAAAANEYRSIVPLDTLPPKPRVSSPEQAMLANNLGAILQDAGDPDAVAAFARAVDLLGDQDLGQLRVNLARQALQSGQAAQAVTELEQAQRLLPPSGALALALAEARRANDQLPQATAALEQATAQISSAKQVAPAAWQPMLDDRANAEIATERARLRLTETLNARGPLFWALISGGVQTRAPSPSTDALSSVHAQLEQAVEQTDSLGRRWRERAAVADANRMPLDALVATEQARRAEIALQNRQQLLASTEIELARAQGYTPPQGFAALWAGVARRRSPVGQAAMRLQRLQAVPDNVEAQIELGRVLLLQNKPAEAAQQFDDAATSGRPEPLYGQALVARRSDDARARQLLQDALNRDKRFYPARELLAVIAEEQGDWATVVAQRRALAQQFGTAERQLALGRALRLSGQANAAEAEQVLLPLANADDPDALLELGQLYETNNNPAAARIVLERANAVAPRNPQVAYYLGQALEAQGDEVGAKAQYRIAIDADPRYVDAYLALATLSRDDPAAATRAYRSAIEADLNDPAALKRIGAVLLENNDADTATMAFQRAIEFKENDAEAHHGLARAYLQRGQLDDALAEEQRALELRDNLYPEAWVGMGDIALVRGEPQQAIAHYSTAIQQNDDLISAHLGLGRAHANQRAWDAALVDFRIAVERDPNSAEARLWLGEARIRQGDTPGAIEAYQDALQLRPGYPEALFGLAQAQFDQQQADAALSSVNAALAQRPAYAEALLLKGKIFEAQGQDAAAQDAYTQAVAANDQLGEPYYRRGLLRVRQKQITDAREDFERAVAVQDNFPEAHYWLGRTYLVEDRPQDAEAQFATAILQRDGSYPEAQFYRGLAQEQLGQPDSALASFQAVLEQARSSDLGREAEAAITRLAQP